LAKAKEYQAVVAVEKCLSATPNIKVQMLENIYEMGM
jgi:hypothetical protein